MDTNNPNPTLRLYNADDFEMVRTWWHDHHGNDFRPGFVSRAAFVVETAGKPAGYFSMHPMDCDFCYLGFPMVDTKADKESREKTVDFIIDAAKLWAKNAAIPIVYISTRGEKLLNRLRDKGFVPDNGGNTHMFCKVGEIK